MSNRLDFAAQKGNKTTDIGTRAQRRMREYDNKVKAGGLELEINLCVYGCDEF